MSSTEAIKLDYNRISCPTPINDFKNKNIEIGMKIIHIYINMFV